MKLRLFKKYFFTAAAVILLSITSIMIILTFVFNHFVAKTSFESLSEACSAVSDYMTEATSQEEIALEAYKDNLSVTVRNIARISKYDIFLSNNSGEITCCSCPEWQEKQECSHSLQPLDRELLQKAEGNEAYFAINTLGLYDAPHNVAILNIKNGEQNLGYAIATMPITAAHTTIRKTMQLYLASAIFPIIIMFFAIYIMTLRLTKPMKLMSQAAKAMAQGDFSRRIPVTSDDEMGELAISFNQMTNSLARLEGMRKSFVANVSHELKTPMTTIAGFIDGILDGTIPEDKQEQYLETISAEVKRLSRLVQSMLELAKLESGEFTFKFESFDFKDMLLDIVINQEQRIEQKRLEILGLDSLPNVPITADKDLLHQVIYNLTDNAIKFSDEGGYIQFALKSDKQHLMFTIKNTGKGIPKAELPFIFERFYKVDKSRSANKSSTGLGLHIAKTIIKSHGGTITATSKENEFTAFEVILPLSR